MSLPVRAIVLVIDDEPGIERTLRTILERGGFQVAAARNLRQPLEARGQDPPDPIHLDAGLPGPGKPPTVILSVLGTNRDEAVILDPSTGGCAIKPLELDELLARILVALRHGLSQGAGPPSAFQTGELEVNLERRTVRVRGQSVKLSPTEFALLRAFISHPDKVLTDRMLLQEVWGPEHGNKAHYLHVYVGRLRRKLEEDPRTPRYLITDPGVGYRLVCEDD